MMTEPPWLLTARSLIGFQARHSPLLAQLIGGMYPDLMWTAKLQSAGCGPFIGYCLAVHGIKPPCDKEKTYHLNYTKPYYWSIWGAAVTEPRPGDVMIVDNTGTHHCGFYIAQEGDYYTDIGMSRRGGVMICKFKLSRVQHIRRNIDA